MIPARRHEEEIEEQKTVGAGHVAEIIRLLPAVPEEDLDDVASEVDTLIRRNGNGQLDI